MLGTGNKDKDGKYWYEYLANAKQDPTLASTVLRGFAKVQYGQPQVEFHIKTLQILGASLEVVSERVKSNVKAQHFRNRGNSLLSSNADAAKVVEMYTQSIAYALPGSGELALAYGNRSAVSYKRRNYEDCLIDIEKSLESGYPDGMKAKLYARRVRCLVALARPKADVQKALADTRNAMSKMDEKASGRDLVVKTLIDRNHMAPRDNTENCSLVDKSTKVKPRVQDDSCEIPGATGIKIQYSKKFGRHLVATRDIRPGDIIAVFNNYANARSPEKCYYECAQCTKTTNVGIPCDHCVNVIYCSTSCRDEAWKLYHEIECPVLGVILDLGVPTKTLLAVRITLRALKETGSVCQLKKLLTKLDSISDSETVGFTGNVFDCSKYASVYSLTNHSGKQLRCHDYCVSLMTTFAVYYLATRTEIFGQKYDADLRVFDKNPSLGFVAGLMIRNGAIADETDAGDTFVAPLIALCKHSCNANVMFMGFNNNIAFAAEPIKAGEQIWTTYLGLEYINVPKPERHQLLQRYHKFSCKCVACVNNWPIANQLPSYANMPRMSRTTRKLLSDAVCAYSLKAMVTKVSGKLLEAKDDLVKLLELLFEHACPSREIVNYQDELINIMFCSHDFS
ncbi:SET and MYND domain-containing protein 4 [Diachasma alloeum]|uniref:SET and MYND domain-containing protein 4 n=1 Tax=Diachasma alloeum TaxID=454923 RepID=UPI0007381E70|nr:SET and MYND domain-containing protein 4 [Diachasma alloeum]XP_015117809.1 SET and MYND domain-containing protein 4 [Diachasma alloeum]